MTEPVIPVGSEARELHRCVDCGSMDRGQPDWGLNHAQTCGGHVPRPADWGQGTGHERVIPAADRLFIAGAPRYTCPYGHPVPTVVAVPCDTCEGAVTYEPASHGMALHAEVKRLRDIVRELRQFVPCEKPEQGPLPGWTADIAARADALLDEYTTEAPSDEPDDDGPRCPDCRIGPDVGDNCPICADHAEAQQRDKAIYAAGWEDAMNEAPSGGER